MALIFITYLAGILTILSPCILPVLPFVFSRAEKSFLKSGLPMLIGMSVTFALISALALIGGEWLTSVSGIGRTVAMILFAVLGLSLLWPQFSDKIFLPISRLGNKISPPASRESTVGSLLVGAGTGLLWAPCAGPVLGLVLTGAVAQDNKTYSATLLMAYALGAATSLALALFAGKKVFLTLKKFMGFEHVFRQVLGVAILFGVIIIAFNLDRTVLTRISKIETVQIENSLLKLVNGPQQTILISDKDGKAYEGLLPEISGAVAWLNSKELSREDLKGKVVLIDFWTYSCINCLRTLPYVKSWAEKYKNTDLVIIGVHAPEFSFERDVSNVKSAVKDLGITYPVAIDNDYKIWRSFKNRFWPAHYFIDRQGRIRHHHFGEGKYDESENIIRQLLSENGEAVKVTDVQIDAEGAQAAAQFNLKRSPETYLGAKRTKNFSATPEIRLGKTAAYTPQSLLVVNGWALDGEWLVQENHSVAKASGARIVYKFNARDVHLVLGGAQNIKFKVKIDGKPPGESHGVDIDSNGDGEINGHRLYQLIRLHETELKEHVFEIEFATPGAEAYAFTFG